MGKPEPVLGLSTKKRLHRGLPIQAENAHGLGLFLTALAVSARFRTIQVWAKDSPAGPTVA